MPRATVHKTSPKVLCILPQVIHFPSQEDLPHLCAGFARLAGSAVFRQVVGSVDGCHVCVKPPTEDTACYLNRKLFYSVQFQAVCDQKAKFMDVFIGIPGSVHDSMVLKLSTSGGGCHICPGGHRLLHCPAPHLSQQWGPLGAR